MASKIYRLYGTSKWAKFQKPDEKYGHFGLDFFPDDKSWDLIDDSGLQLKRKKTEEGVFISLRRANQKLIKGELVNFGPPVVVDELGREFTDLIGNGSTVSVEVVVYDTQKGKGHRLDKVTVLKHVPYNKVEDAHEDMEVVEPEPTGTGSTASNKASSVKDKDIPQDDIPW